MNYSDWHKVMKQKVSRYDAAQLTHAKRDCYATLEIWDKDKGAEDYCVKLWAEIDAIRERESKLSKGE